MTNNSRYRVEPDSSKKYIVKGLDFPEGTIKFCLPPPLEECCHPPVRVKNSETPPTVTLKTLLKCQANINCLYNKLTE